MWRQSSTIVGHLRSILIHFRCSKQFGAYCINFNLWHAVSICSSWQFAKSKHPILVREKPVEKGHGKRNGINIILWETLVARGAFVPKRCQDVNRQTVKEYFSSRIRSYKNVLWTRLSYNRSFSENHVFSRRVKRIFFFSY